MSMILTVTTATSLTTQAPEVASSRNQIDLPYTPYDGLRHFPSGQTIKRDSYQVQRSA